MVYELYSTTDIAFTSSKHVLLVNTVNLKLNIFYACYSFIPLNLNYIENHLTLST